MARSYGRRKAARKGGLLVRENPVQRVNSINSLYSLPVKKTYAAGFSGTVIQKGAVAGRIQFGTGSSDPTLDNVVRISTMLCSSKSPFTVKVYNTADGVTTYQCPGQTVAKITLSKESSKAGNPAALAGTGMNKALIQITDAEDQVDVTYNIVVDSAMD